MSKFNKRVSTPNPTPSINEAGGQVFQMTERQRVINYVLNATTQGNFYKKGSQELTEMQDLIKNIKDPLFAAKAAVWARHEHGARPMSHVIAAEILHALKGKGVAWMRNFLNAVICRVDDSLEILSYYMSLYGKPIPSVFKRAVSDALADFDEYQLSKYRKENSEVSLKDLVMLCRPKPSIKNHVALKKLLDGKLKQTKTVTAKLSEAGKKESKVEIATARKEAFNELITEKKLGYTALILNFVDICKEAGEDEFNQACEYLTNEKAIRNSLVYPMKYYILYQALVNNPISDKTRYNKAIRAINQAMEISFKNIPKLEGKKILVAQDISGSMASSTFSIKHGDGDNAVEVPTRTSDYAAMFGTALLKSNNDVDYMVFNMSSYYVENINVADSFMTMVKNLSLASGGTDMSTIFRGANKGYDVVIILSDNETWGHARSLQADLVDYRKRYGKNTILVTWDIYAKNTNPFTDKRAIFLSGYSAKVLEAIGAVENEELRIEKQIEAIDFKKFIKKVPHYKGDNNKTMEA